MALDRFIYFEGHRPTFQDLQQLLNNFLGGAGTVSLNRDRFFVLLPGEPTFSFKGFPRVLEPAYLPETRWIEVCYTSESVDVLTRHQDEFTNALADQIAELIKRYWKGTDEPSTSDTPQGDTGHTDGTPPQ